MMLEYFTFNGISSKDKLIILSANRSIAPEIEDTLVTIPGRPGALDFGGRIGLRRITIDFAIIGKSQEDLEQKKRELAAWLVTEEAKPLSFSDEPGIEYRARLTGQTDIDRVFRVGTGQLTFICADPFRYETQPRFYQADVTNGGILEVVNPGSFPVCPVINIKNISNSPVNLCENPGFESDTSGWFFQNTGGSSGAFVRDTIRRYSGVASGKLIKLNTDAAIPRVYFTVSEYTAGKSYPFEAYVYSDVEDGLTVYVEEETSDFQYIQVSDTMTSGPPGQWNKISATAVPTDSSGTMFVFFEARQLGAYDSWIDEVALFDTVEGMGVVRNPSLTLGNQTIKFNGDILPGQALVLDLENWMATINGANVLSKITGDFFNIPSGTNQIRFNADLGRVRIETSIRGRWL